MLKRLTSFLLSLPVALSLACEVTDEPSAFVHEEPETALEGPTELAHALDPQANAALAAQIAAHPAYPALSAYAWTRAGEMYGAYAALDGDDAVAESERLALCKQQATPIACYQDLSGVDVSFAIAPAAKAAALDISNGFQLAALSLHERVEVFHAAQLAYVGAGGPGGSPALIPDAFGDGSSCDAACKQQELTSLAYVQAGFVAAATDTSGGAGAAGDLFVKLLIELAQAAVEAYIDCIIDPECYPWPTTDPANDECDGDDDCPSSEFCWKGPLGVGENECRDKKENGQYCSRDGKCESDCCKFNLWDGGSTCRPANECN